MRHVAQGALNASGMLMLADHRRQYRFSIIAARGESTMHPPLHHPTSAASGDIGDAPAPHQLANELTRNPSVQATGEPPETRRPESVGLGEGVPRVERRVGRLIAAVVLAAVVLGLMISAVLFQRIALLAIGAVFIIPFLLLVSAPVWLASATKVAQDETVHEQRQSSAG